MNEYDIIEVSWDAIGCFVSGAPGKSERPDHPVFIGYPIPQDKKAAQKEQPLSRHG